MAVTVRLRYVRHSAKKLRPVLALFRQQPLELAIHKTAVMHQDSARILHQALKSARAAAQAKEFNPEELVISGLFATEGPRIKRMRPNARGRSNKYQKHLAHLTVSVNQIAKAAPVAKPKSTKPADQPAVKARKVTK